MFSLPFHLSGSLGQGPRELCMAGAGLSVRVERLFYWCANSNGSRG